MDNWAGAIQHAVTVTRPDPSRAEIAMHICAALAATPRYDDGTTEDLIGETLQITDALRAALEKAKP
jgi:hypothetical protein